MSGRRRMRWRMGARVMVTLFVASGCASSGGVSASASGTTTARGCPPAAPRSEMGAVLPSGAKGTVIGGAAGAATGSSPASTPVRDPQVALRQICAMMARSADAWNRGRLDAFVEDYLEGEEATYIGSRGIVRGRSAIREVYAPRFAPGGVRDSLSFERVEVDLLAPDLANTIAWYVLMRGDSVTARGPTSLVMRRVGGAWRIVHDHSS